jgi:hypothetical protein
MIQTLFDFFFRRVDLAKLVPKVRKEAPEEMDELVNQYV